MSEEIKKAFEKLDDAALEGINGGLTKEEMEERKKQKLIQKFNQAIENRDHGTATLTLRDLEKYLTKIELYEYNRRLAAMVTGR